MKRLIQFLIPPRYHWLLFDPNEATEAEKEAVRACAAIMLDWMKREHECSLAIRESRRKLMRMCRHSSRN